MVTVSRRDFEHTYNGDDGMDLMDLKAPGLLEIFERALAGMLAWVA
jgi:hypothetical protein